MNLRNALNILPGTAKGDLARTRAMTKGKTGVCGQNNQLYSYNNLIAFQCLLRPTLTSSVCMMYR